VSRKTVAASLRRQELAGISPRRFAPATTTNLSQPPLPYNVLPDWNLDAFAQALGVTQVATVNTAATLRAALAAAKAHATGPSVIRALVGGRSLPAGL
jgi:hypothetical protein